LKKSVLRIERRNEKVHVPQGKSQKRKKGKKARKEPTLWRFAGFEIFWNGKKVGPVRHAQGRPSLPRPKRKKASKRTFSTTGLVIRCGGGSKTEKSRRSCVLKSD